MYILDQRKMMLDIYELKYGGKKMNIEVKRVKIVVTVPLENVDVVRDAVCEAGAGVIGNYKNCSTATRCIGTFIPCDNAKPYIGKNNVLEVVEEEKLEVVCDINIVSSAIKALREAHPYEEPAIDIIPLIDEDYFNI